MPEHRPNLGVLVAVTLAVSTASADPPARRPPSRPSSPPEPVAVDIGVRVGPQVRLGSAPNATIADRAGPVFGVGAWITPMRFFTFGLSYEHGGLGREVGGDGNPDYFEISRSLNTLWGDVRAHFFRTDRVRLSLLIGLGLNWQNAAAAGAFSQEIGQPLFTVRCTGNDSANFSFRAGVGGRFVIGNGVSFLLDAVLDEVRLSTSPLDECVAGGGTMTLLSARAGLAYGFDITRLFR